MAAQRLNAAVQTAAPQRQAPVNPHRQETELRVFTPRRQPGVQSAAVSAIRIARIAVICVAAFIMLSLLIYQRAQLASLNVDCVHAEDQLTKAKSETVRLEAQFNSIVSVENVDEYAKNVLGMVKRSSYQVHFFPNDNNDEIVRLEKGE